MRRFLLVLVFLTAIDFCLMFAYCRFSEFCAGYTDFFGKVKALLLVGISFAVSLFSLLLYLFSNAMNGCEHD